VVVVYYCVFIVGLLQITFPIPDTEVQQQPCRSTVETLLSPFLQFRKRAEDDSVDTNSSSGAECSSEDLNTSTEQTKPQVIYGSYFTLTYSCDSLFSELYRNTKENSNSYIMACGIGSAELSKYVSKAKSIFSTLYPDEEFLPKAPDCDESEVMNGDDIDISELSPPNENPVVNPEAANDGAQNDEAVPNRTNNDNEGVVGEE